MVTALPIYKIKGKYYYLDKRLGEYRNVKDPGDRKPFDEVLLGDLEKPGTWRKKSKSLFGLPKLEGVKW